jgi:hypothetical protein
MTIEEAKEYLPDFEAFRNEACATCTEEWYCPRNCEDLNKASRMDYDRILKCYARNGGEMHKVFAFIRGARI